MSDLMKSITRLCNKQNLDKRLKKIDPYDSTLSSEDKALVFSACRISEEYFCLIVRNAPSTMRLVTPELVSGGVKQLVLEGSEFERVLLDVLRESEIQVASLSAPSIKAWLFDSGDLAVLLKQSTRRRGVKVFIKTDPVVITRNGATFTDSELTSLDIATLFDCDWVE
ncbi:hypothetical protein pEaSNUABM54_00298 [Erwinia phage pEa_SNUABM_54]|nr:hypothetical protein pEaSNUABM54_00298 [Erwinia phage pEa_SNUABM_54]